MKYEILSTGRFKKDLKAIIKRGYNVQLLQEVVSMLAAELPYRKNIKTIC